MEFTEVEGPNKKAFSVLFPEIPADFEQFERLNVVKNDFEAVSGFLKKLGEARKDLRHIDAVRTEGGLLLTMSAALPWAAFLRSDPKTKPRELIKNWTSSLFDNAARVHNSFHKLETPDPERLPVKVATHALNSPDVQKTLKEDGGDMILIDAPYDKGQNSFHVDFMLMGGCKGCGKATTHTLKEIERRVQIRLDEIAKTAPEGHFLKNTKFTGIQVVDQKGSFYQPRLVKA